MENPVCPNCGCDKPKKYFDGGFRCVDCNCELGCLDLPVVDENSSDSDADS